MTSTEDQARFVAPSMQKAFILALIINFLWINVSEVFRYFVFVMPMMRAHLTMVEAVAPMNWGVFMMWGIWDSVLVVSATGFYWLVLQYFGPSLRNAMMAGCAFAITVFGLLWFGLFNMNLATASIMAVAIPLALLEQVIAAMIVRWGIGWGIGWGMARS